MSDPKKPDQTPATKSDQPAPTPTPSAATPDAAPGPGGYATAPAPDGSPPAQATDRFQSTHLGSPSAAPPPADPPRVGAPHVVTAGHDTQDSGSTESTHPGGGQQGGGCGSQGGGCGCACCRYRTCHRSGQDQSWPGPPPWWWWQQPPGWPAQGPAGWPAQGPMGWPGGPQQGWNPGWNPGAQAGCYPYGGWPGNMPPTDPWAAAHWYQVMQHHIARVHAHINDVYQAMTQSNPGGWPGPNGMPPFHSSWDSLQSSARDLSLAAGGGANAASAANAVRR